MFHMTGMRIPMMQNPEKLWSIGTASDGSERFDIIYCT